MSGETFWSGVWFSYKDFKMGCRNQNWKQSSRVLVPAGTSKSTLRRHGIQAVTRVMAYVADAVTLMQ
jgi:hypothetical protein